MKKDYKKIYKKYHSNPQEIKKRASRNAARKLMVDKGLAKKGDGMHIDHKNNNPLDNRLKNLRVVTRTTNLTKKKS